MDLANNMEKKKQNISTLSVNVLCSLYISAWVLLPAFRNLTDGGYYKFLFFIFALFWLVTSLMIKKSWMKDILPSVFLGLIYPLIMMIYYVFNFGNINLGNFVPIFFLFLCVLMGEFYKTLNNVKVDNILLRFIFLFFTITSITTIYNLSINFNASRMLTSSSTSIESRAFLEAKNIGSFDFIYGSVIFLPFLIIIMSNKWGLSKVPFNLIGLLIVITIALSNFTTAYIFLGLSLLVFFIPSKKKIKPYFIVFIFIVILALPVILPIIMSFLIWLLNIVKEITPSIMTQNKIDSIIEVLLGKNSVTETSVRFSYINNSFKSFFKSPLIGRGAYYNTHNIVGDHAQFIDDLARFGALGTLPLLGMFYKIFKSNFKMIENIAIKYGYVLSILVFVLLGFLNPIYSYGIVFVMFILLSLISRKLDRN